jgi:putative membrane protein
MKTFVRWLLLAAALLLVAHLYPGVTVKSFGSAMIAALVLGLTPTHKNALAVVLRCALVFYWRAGASKFLRLLFCL